MMDANPDRRARVDALVAEKYPRLSNRHIDEALDKELVLDAQGKKLKKGTKIHPDTPLNFDKLNAHLRRLKEGNPNLKIAVMEETPEFCVISKPFGMPSHPISLFDENTVTHWAFSHFKGIEKEFPEIQPTVSPHRLDTDTEGLLIVCKTKASYEEWRERFHTKQIKKRYLAWVQGIVAAPLKTDVPIAHNSQLKSKMVAVEGEMKYAPPIQSAHSEITPIKTVESKNISLVEVSCKTGVTHQVRVHLAHLGHPLVGDRLYDDKVNTRLTQAEHHLLLAYELTCEGKTYSVEKNHFIKLY